MPCESLLWIIQRQSGEGNSKNPGFLAYGSEKSLILVFERSAWDVPRLQAAFVMPRPPRDGRRHGRPDNAEDSRMQIPRPWTPGSWTRSSALAFRLGSRQGKILDSHQLIGLVE